MLHDRHVLDSFSLGRLEMSLSSPRFRKILTFVVLRQMPKRFQHNQCGSSKECGP
jgi:hypothetical protein